MDVPIEDPRQSAWNELLDKLHKAERELDQAREQLDALNDMLRLTGYGQGQIDAYDEVCRERDEAREKAKEILSELNDEIGYRWDSDMKWSLEEFRKRETEHLTRDCSWLEEE